MKKNIVSAWAYNEVLKNIEAASEWIAELVADAEAYKASEDDCKYARAAGTYGGGMPYLVSKLDSIKWYLTEFSKEIDMDEE